VTFIPTNRNASKISGRKTPYIADLLTALAAAPEDIVGIVNSDLIFEPGPDWRHILPQAVKQAVVVGQRNDTVSLFGAIPKKYFWGFDYFFFEKGRIGQLIDSSLPFAMGLPWWDYWLPIALAFQGCDIRRLERPAIIHLDHGKGFKKPSLRSMAQYFIRFVIQSADRDPAAVPARLHALVTECRKVPDTAALENGTFDKQIDDVARLCAKELQAKNLKAAESVDSDRVIQDVQLESGDLTPRRIFQRFRDQLHAGEVRSNAFALSKQGRLSEAERLYRTVLESVPDDVDSLCNLGAILNQQGRFQDAAALLRKAVALRPSVPLSQILLGNALAALSQHDEAIACFERAVAIDSDFEDHDHFALAHYNLAGLLNSRGRYTEALTQLKRALSYKPDYPPATTAYQQLSRALSEAKLRPG
jgi:tetratricopeptide (TPR) repeat protein